MSAGRQGHHLDATTRERIRALGRAGETPAEIKRQTGAARNTISDVLRKAQIAVAPPTRAPEPDSPAARRETRDAAFWQAQARRTAEALADVERTAEALAGLRDAPWRPAEWLVARQPASPHRAVLGALLSDFHVGEVVDADEVLNLNAYDEATFRRRIRTYFEAAVAIGPRWAADCALEGALVLLGGDLISGDIHEELRMTNDLTAHESARVAAEEIAAGLRLFADAFGRVHVVSVPGNHGRNQLKKMAKLYSRLSYDTVAAMMVADKLSADSRITWQVSPSTDAIVPVLGWTIFLTHGDNMGSGGGQGFGGPILPIVRGTKKVALQQAAAKRPFDLVCHGHFHHSANPGPVLSNGSLPGYTEYGNGLRAALEPPQQWLFLMHERWGLRERSEIKLEPLATRQKPRVRVPAQMR